MQPIDDEQPREDDGPVRWWSAKRFAEFAVHFVIFCILWLSWSRFAGEPADEQKMVFMACAVAAGLTWGTRLFGKKSA